jgi:catalase
LATGKKLTNNAVTWDILVTLANSEDDVDNAAIAWQGKHQQIMAAELTINAIQLEQEGKCDLINFDPLILSNGFAPSDDPLLQARKNAYAVAHGRRLAKKQSIMWLYGWLLTKVKMASVHT